MTQDQIIIQRDFYYQRTITVSDILKFIGVSFAVQFAAYYYIICITSLLAPLDGTATHVVLQVLLTIPVAIFLPSFLIHRYLSSVIPKRFSLKDDKSQWYRKAIRLMGIEEILRFCTGLLPLSFTAYGVLTSPITYLLYTLVYVNPMQRYDEIILNYQVGVLDIIVFLSIYSGYFAIYNLCLIRKFKQEVFRHHLNLESSLKEKEKTQMNYKKGAEK